MESYTEIDTSGNTVKYQAFFGGSELGTLAGAPEIKFFEKFREFPVYDSDGTGTLLKTNCEKCAGITLFLRDVKSALAAVESASADNKTELLIKPFPAYDAPALSFGNCTLEPETAVVMGGRQERKVKLTFLAKTDPDTGKLFICG